MVKRIDSFLNPEAEEKYDLVCDLSYEQLLGHLERCPGCASISVVVVYECDLVEYDRLWDGVKLENKGKDLITRENFPLKGFVTSLETVEGFQKQVYTSLDEINEFREKMQERDMLSISQWNKYFVDMAKKTALIQLIGEWFPLIELDAYSDDGSKLLNGIAYFQGKPSLFC